MILLTFLMLQVAYMGCALNMTNPFEGHKFFIPPDFRVNIAMTIAGLSTTDPDFTKILTNLNIARDVGSALWLDGKYKVNPSDTGLGTMNGALAEAAKETPAPMTIFIIYNIPNRDCAATASRGELCCAYGSDGKCDLTQQDGDCLDGINAYKNEYINNIVSIASNYKGKVPMTFIIEPDAIGNLVKGGENNVSCGKASQTAYKEGIAYAVNELYNLDPNIPLYLDIAHSGWLGSQSLAQKAAQIVTSFGILDKIRGFSTNVSNYNQLGSPCPEAGFCLGGKNAGHICCSDPCKRVTDVDGSNSELSYVQQLSVLMPGKKFVIDTSRNGVPNARTNCDKEWCNPRNTGLGPLPTTYTSLPIVEAYLWIKTPGESDGCTDCDNQCRLPASLGTGQGEPKMPNAGTFSEFQMTMLARNAAFGIQ